MRYFRPLWSSWALLCSGIVACSSSTASLFSPSGGAGDAGVLAASGASGASGFAGVSGTSGMISNGLGGSAAASSAAAAGSLNAAGEESATPGTVAGAGTGGAPSGIESEAGGAGDKPSESSADYRCDPGCCAASEGEGEGILLADSVKGFSDTQGRCGWSFGYLPLGLEPFTALALYSTEEDGSPVWAASASRPPWLTIASTEQHPNDTPLAWVDRRWTSTVSGSIALRGHVAKVDAGVTGDGIVAIVQVAGAEIWRQALAFNDTRGQDFALTAEVQVGTAIDFIVAPGPTDAHDTTLFTAVISREGP